MIAALSKHVFPALEGLPACLCKATNMPPNPPTKSSIALAYHPRVYFFALYAGIVWFGVNYFRRKWPAYLVLLFTIPVALAGVQLIRYLLHIDNMILSIVATAYEALILMVGVMIVLVPQRKHALAPCHRCRYDLTGNTSGTCPECGRTHDTAARDRREALAPATAPEPALRSPDATP